MQGVANLMSKVRGGRVRFDPDRILMGGGATGANELIMFCLANPGDAFLVPSPYYPAYVPLLSSLLFSFNESHYFTQHNVKSGQNFKQPQSVITFLSSSKGYPLMASLKWCSESLSNKVLVFMLPRLK